ncbi:MAG TPA: DUF5916 domain-containing protein [Vicinamibacterales bacterium]|nr:DUF5916 domain-containing protein [Vicinamibacterales bacterium]
MPSVRVSLLMAVLVGWAATAGGQPSLVGTTFHITRATGPIRIDGDLSDEAWRTATRIETWYEVQPGDNAVPSVKSIGYLTYDDRFFYAAFEFDDPNPSTIRAPLGDHDAINGNSMDFGGIFIDPLNTGRTAFEFFVNPRNVQYDAVTDDSSGENASPDFFWDSAARITDHGWIVEMRIPFSTLRYRNVDPQTWGIILFRNYPRQYRYQLMSARIPRGNNCLICHENVLSGLEGLPKGGHLIAAPYASASDTAHPAGDVLGSPLVAAPIKPHVGVDVKLTPDANNAIDLTVKPDFSQVESDTAQISANERFALLFPEKRPFFLEGVDLLQTAIQAVYTRTITAPAWGGRVTGNAGGIRYTALVTEDSGGGSAILPGPNDSSTASQDFASRVFVGRAKRDIGLSFVGALVTDREAVDASAHNRVAGPDFQWRLSGADVLTGQWLFSETRTPDRPDLAGEWNGQRLNGSAFQTNWSHNTRHLDWYAKYSDVGSGFRADTGFVPQVGYREAYGYAGWSVHPTGFVSLARPFVTLDYQAEPSGPVITRDVEPGIGLNTWWSGFMQFRYIDNPTLAGDTLIRRKQFGYSVQFSPSRRLSSVALNGTLGQDIDFENARPAHGSTINASATLQATDHLALDLLENTRWLNVDGSQSAGARLFIQRVSRVKGTYAFTSRLFVRVIGQYVRTTRDPSLYTSSVDARSGTFGGSALVAYKINWQSVMFVGYGDDRELLGQRRLARLDRQFFVKLSYAFQR